MHTRSYRWRWNSLVVVTALLALAETFASGAAASQQPQQHWAQLDDDAPAQAPTVHLSTHIIPPPAPWPAASHHSSSLQKHSAAEPGSSDVARARVPVVTVAWMALAMALMSCLGVVPYLFVRQLSKPWAGASNAIASGVMLAASFGLLQEGAAYSGAHLVAGMLLGVLFVRFSQTYLKDFEVEGFEQLAGADARKLILFLAVMAVHAVGEGGGVGVSFAGHRGWAQGTLVTLAIGLHNVPEGLAVATVMAAKGTPPRRILLWTALTALPQALVAPPAYIFVDTFKALLPLALGFAAGCMMWIVFAMLLPDALEVIEAERVATYTTGAAAWLQGLSVFMAQLETPAGTLASPFGDHPLIMHLGIVPLLLHLLPACIVPGLVSVAAAKVQLSKPTAVSAAAGLLASYTLASGVHLLWSSEHRLLCAACAPLLGALGAGLAWKQRQGSRNKQKKAHVTPSHSKLHCNSCSTASVEAQGHCTALVNGGGPAAAVECVPVGVLSAAGSRHRVSAGGFEREASFNSWQPQQMLHGFRPLGHWDVPVHGVADPYDAASVSHSNSSSTSSCFSSWSSSQQPAAAPLGTRILGLTGSPLLPCSNPSKQHLLGHLASRNVLCLCEANESCTQLRVFEGLGHCRDSGAVDSACWLALCGAGAYGAVLGVQLAASITIAPDNLTHVTVPLILLGCMFAVMHMGLLTKMLQSSSHILAKPYIAAAASSVPIAVALGLLVLLPDWVHHVPAAFTVEVLKGLSLGLNFAALVLLLKNVHKFWGRQKCSAGFGVGFCGGLLLHVGLAVLCLYTSCCLGTLN